VWLVAADCFFIGLAPVLVHMAKNADGKYNFHPVAINLMIECAKLTFATATLIVNVRLPGLDWLKLKLSRSQHDANLPVHRSA